ncbi:cytochrome P450 [Nocardiopsis sp. N85]|uniref:cytochrome P450 n=1 Tax=Nocardiopsis sp. N85 TaxID=3029400 RepID=UPI00237F9128|nr:cytochrome P450 [Nocardiopsis sp. N85]MDE3723351.1 cytochrome P450 [Nocardiopsis sp. N85]
MHQGTGPTDHEGTASGDGAGRCPYSEDGALALHRGGELPWRQLRERHGGLVPVELGPGVPGWLLLGYKENLQALRDQTYFSADPRPWRSAGSPARSGALGHDGTEHQRLRAPIVEALAAVGTAQLVPVVERAAVHLLGRAAADGSADLIGQYAAPLPAMVFNELFGLPDEYGRLLADIAERSWSADPREAADAGDSVRGYFHGLVERKRREPGEDLVGHLLAHPNALTDEEAVEALSMLWATGHEPTTHLIGNALLKLLEDPNVWTAYLGGTLTPEDFIDYVMWTDSPIQVLAGRYSTMDIRFSGAHIRKGEPLLFGLASAHTDPSVSRGGDDAMALAGNRSHLAWGAGAHRCPATAFSREMVRTAIDMAVDRLRGMVLAVEPADLRRRPSLSMHGLEELPVWFTATGERTERQEPPREAGPMRTWIRRRRRPAAQGARYQAPLSREGGREESETVVAVPAPKRRRAPQGAGARYQAPFAKQEDVPDPLDRLLATWSPRG